MQKNANTTSVGLEFVSPPLVDSMEIWMLCMTAHQSFSDLNSYEPCHLTRQKSINCSSKQKVLCLAIKRQQGSLHRQCTLYLSGTSRKGTPPPQWEVLLMISLLVTQVYLHLSSNPSQQYIHCQHRARTSEGREQTERESTQGEGHQFAAV